MILLWLVYLQALVYAEASNSSTLERPAACRTERRMYLLYDHYRVDTCARCYLYMPLKSFKENAKFRYTDWSGLLRHPFKNASFEATPLNTSQELLDSFIDESEALKWTACCFKAIECCNRMLEMPPLQTDEPHCPRTWDGWQCWDDTLGGTTAVQTCQPHIYFEISPPSCTKYVYKVCWENGTWFREDGIREWTNYTKCGSKDVYKRFLYFHIITYAVSVVSMIPSLFIFSIYKQLHVQRIAMHKNLFLSLLLHGVAVLLYKSLVVLDEYNRSPTYQTVEQRNGGGCQFLLILTKYFRVSNYMWMFNEGFYLHKLIAAAFAEQKSLLMFYLIGWVLPVFPVGVYGIMRKVYHDEKCWAHPFFPYEWIMMAPNMASLFINLFFLGNIIRVLVTKLRATHSNEPSQYRKAVRATLVLVPLFGLQFCIVIYRPQEGPCKLLEAYTYFSHAMDGLQGFLVSLIFCYMNGEVLYLLRRSYQRFRLSHPLGGRFQNSFMLNPMSVTQESTLNDSHHNGSNHQGLHCRLAKGRRSDAFSKVSNGRKNSAVV